MNDRITYSEVITLLKQDKVLLTFYTYNNSTTTPTPYLLKLINGKCHRYDLDTRSWGRDPIEGWSWCEEDWTRPIIYAGSLVEFALEYGKQF